MDSVSKKVSSRSVSSPSSAPRFWPSLAVGSSALALVVLGLALLGMQSPVIAGDDDDLNSELARLESMSSEIEEMLGVFIIERDKREMVEGVLIKARRAEVWFLRPLDKNIEDAKCDALRWIFLGRFGDNVGAPEIFERFKDLDRLTLVFYKVVTEVRSDRKGGYVQDRTPVRQLEVSVDRERAMALDPKRLRSILLGSRSSCIESGEKLANRHWYAR